jgi:hypothetical protein
MGITSIVALNYGGHDKQVLNEIEISQDKYRDKQKNVLLSERDSILSPAFS